ncbi:retrovirus-related pol polyprotein from transposon TNT 1-94 [Tanacetum coccineum]
MGNVKKDIDEIETINIELEHNLNAQLQEKVFAITTLKNELRKLKGKNVVNTAVSKPNATIALGMFKLDIEPRTIWMLMRTKRVRFAEPVTSSNNIPNQTDSLQTKDYNKPLLTFTGVKPTTSASGSKPSGNTKNYRVSRPPRSNPKNNIEDHSREVKSSLNKMNFVSEPISNALVMYYVRNAKFESICAICNKCLFDANHDMCLIDFVNDVNVVQIVLWYLDSGRSKHMTGNRSQLMNFVSKFMGTVRFRNDQVAKIIGYGDYQQGDILKLHFGKNTCFIQNLEGVDLLSSSRDINLYTISLDDMLKTSPICLLSKASKTKSWLWHRRLSHLNFGTLNKLAKDGLARGIQKLKFQKDHLCLACALGKSKKSSHQSKAEDTNQEKLYLLHMDLCGPMRVTLRDFYENVGISHQTFVARTPQQNDIVERQNQTLVEAARTMLIFSKAPLTPYELMHDKKPDLSFFHVFGSLCYPTNDSEDLGKLSAKANIGPRLQVLTPTTSNSGLIPNIIPQQPCNSPKRDDWDTLFQPLFDEYFNPPTIAVSTVPVAAAPRAVEIANSHVSTSINQEVSSSSIPSTQDQEHSLIISQGVEESPKTPLFYDDPLHEFLHEDSTSQG